MTETEICEKRLKDIRKSLSSQHICKTCKDCGECATWDQCGIPPLDFSCHLKKEIKNV